MKRGREGGGRDRGRKRGRDKGRDRGREREREGGGGEREVKLDTPDTYFITNS